MRASSLKLFRDNLDNMITNAYRKAYPHFEFEHKFLRLPNYPKVILYSNVQSVDSFISQVLPSFKHINPKPSNQTDQVFTKNVARDLTFDNQAEKTSNGVIVQGFPFNSTQALMLDRLLNGVNLAIHVKGESSSQQFSSLLEYYNVRGTLLQIDYKQNLNAEQVEAIQQKISCAMKSDN